MAELAAKTGFWTIDGDQLEFSYIAHPNTTQPLYLLAHEGLGCVAMWRNFPARLSAQLQAPVLSWSRVGYGQSTPKPGPWHKSYLHFEAQQLLPQILAKIDAPQIRLLGHSDGGSIALIYLSGVVDQRIDAAICMAPHAFVEPISVQSIRRIRQQFVQGDLASRLQHYHGNNTQITFEAWSDVWLSDEFSHWNIETQLAKINKPVLLLQGVQDQYGSHLQIDAIKKGLGTAATVHLIDDCRHAPHLQQPTTTLNLIKQFQNSL